MLYGQILTTAFANLRKVVNSDVERQFEKKHSPPSPPSSDHLK